MEFLEALQLAARAFEQAMPEQVRLVYHDDADGVCSAALIKIALQRLGCKVNTLCLEKFYPQVIQDLHSKAGTIFYVDLGASHASWLSSINQGRCSVFILDHHSPEIAADSKVLNLCPELYGISGSTEASASTVCHYFAKALGQADLAWLSVIGSVEIPGNFRGLNRQAMQEAGVKISGKKERYYIPQLGEYADRISTMLTVLASVGYYQDGPSIALQALEQRNLQKSIEVEKRLEKLRKELNQSLLAKLRKEGLKLSQHVQWFHAADHFKGMGSKVIGSFCSFLSFQRFLQPKRYLLGFMHMSSLIPGWGKLEGKLVKVSLRVPPTLKQLIAKQKMPHAGELLKHAVQAIEGVVGEGHACAASAVLHRGQEEALVEQLDRLISSYKPC